MKKLFTLMCAIGFTALTAQPLVNNAQLITHPTGGAGGLAASATETAIGMTLYGAGMQQTAGNWIAESITVPASGWIIDSLICYGYQTGSPMTSSFTGLFAFICADSSGYPMASTPILGSKSVSSLGSNGFSGIYRTPDDSPTGLLNTQRPIMRLQSTLSGNLLTPGTYWVVWNATGSLTSGPWCPPRTVKNTPVTGAAMQYLGSSFTFQNLVSGGNNQGAPFTLWGKIATSVKESEVTINNVNVVPSPMTSNATVNITLAENASVSLSDLNFVMYDITGREVLRNNNITNASFTIQRGDLNAGTYMYSVTNKANGNALNTGKLIIQ
jgi:hypothetical protein